MYRYLNEDECTKLIQSYKLFPRLLTILDKYGYNYDFILIDPAYEFRPMFTSELPYAG